MGVIRKRGNIWYIDFYLDGKRHIKAIGKSKKIAEFALKDIEVRIAKHRAGLPVEYKISDWCSQFYEYIQAHPKPRTVQRYRESLTWFFQFLDTLPNPPFHLSDINPEMIEEFKLHRLDKVKKKTVNNDLAAIKRFLNLAITRDHLHDNPLRKVNFFRLVRKQHPRFLAKDELSEIYDSMDRNEDVIILKTLANTGMRWGELRHLEWPDIDLKDRMITIRSKENWSPKTGLDRKVPINEVVYEILSEAPKKRGYVFSSPKGHIIHDHHLRERLQKTCLELGINEVNLHTFRHTCASHLVMAGVDLPTIAKILGHTDIKTTMIYSHLAGDHIRQAVGKLAL